MVFLTPGEEVSLGVRVADTRKIDFKIGRLAAKRALSALGLENEELRRSESGAPLWPAGIVGSITHTARIGLALVARESDVVALGVDLEHRRTVHEIEELVAFGDEREWVAPAGALDEDRLLSLFAAKEAVYKAFYPAIGRFFGFEAAHLEWDRARSVFSGAFVDNSLGHDPGNFEVSVTWSGDFVLAWLASEN